MKLGLVEKNVPFRLVECQHLRGLQVFVGNWLPCGQWDCCHSQMGHWVEKVKRTELGEILPP